MTEQSTIPGLFCFFVAFYFSLSGRRKGISYRENVLNGTEGTKKNCFVQGKRFRWNKKLP